jgi:hypothetical protein
MLSSWRFWKSSWLKYRKIGEAGKGGRRRGNQLNMGLKGRAESDFNNVIKDHYFSYKALAQHYYAYICASWAKAVGGTSSTYHVTRSI